MITDAGDADGPLTNSLLMYRSEQSGDYHGEFNGEKYAHCSCFCGFDVELHCCFILEKNGALLHLSVQWVLFDFIYNK